MVERFLTSIIQLMQLAIIVGALLSFIPKLDRRNPFVVFLNGLTEPMYRTIRRTIPQVRTGQLDFSPMVAFFGLELIRQIVVQVF